MCDSQEAYVEELMREAAELPPELRQEAEIELMEQGILHMYTIVRLEVLYSLDGNARRGLIGWVSF